jgi:hypothetical protein
MATLPLRGLKLNARVAGEKMDEALETKSIDALSLHLLHPALPPPYFCAQLLCLSPPLPSSSSSSSSSSHPPFLNLLALVKSQGTPPPHTQPLSALHNASLLLPPLHSLASPQYCTVLRKSRHSHHADWKSAQRLRCTPRKLGARR